MISKLKRKHRFDNARALIVTYYMIVVVLLSVFLFSAFMGVFDYALTSKRLSEQVFPPLIGQNLAWINITLQVLASAALAYFLLSERPRTNILLLPIGLMSIYTIYTILILANVFGLRPCSCAHMIPNISWSQAVLFNFGLLGLLIIAYVFSPIISGRRYCNDK